ncbi:hypothetical protein [Pseudomonas lalucatii]|nr:hypothetical protein [Pseudomonas lalucatii]
MPSSPSDHSWFFGMLLGAVFHDLLMRKHCAAKGHRAPVRSHG